MLLTKDSKYTISHVDKNDECILIFKRVKATEHEGHLNYTVRHNKQNPLIFIVKPLNKHKTTDHIFGQMSGRQCC
jgi:hypothetical protein